MQLSLASFIEYNRIESVLFLVFSGKTCKHNERETQSIQQKDKTRQNISRDRLTKNNSSSQINFVCEGSNWNEPRFLVIKFGFKNS